jgi:uncharacterized protein
MSRRYQAIERLCKKFHVEALYVFGSRGRELFQVIQNDNISLSDSQSDLDIGVLTSSPFSIDDKVNLTFELEDLFVGAKVDLFVLQEVDAFLAANIIRGERVHAEDEYLADEYDLFVLRRAGDLAELERQRLAMILQEE